MFSDAWDDLRFPGIDALLHFRADTSPGRRLYLGFEASVAGTVLRFRVTPLPRPASGLPVEAAARTARPGRERPG